MKINTPPLVSIIIRTQDRPLLLKDAILSVENQTYRPIELIVVNDGGQDVSDIIPQSGNEMTYHYLSHDKIQGRSAAANTGLQKAQGKYINLLDDDDILYPHHIQNLLIYLENNRFYAVYSDCELGFYIWKDHQYELKEKKAFLGESFDLGKLFWENFIPSMNIMFQRKLVDEIGLFDETLEIYEDWDYWLRIAKNHSIHRLPGITAQYRQFDKGSVGDGGRGYDFLYWTKLLHQKHFKKWDQEALICIDFLKNDRQHKLNEIGEYAKIVQNREQEIEKLSTSIQNKEITINEYIQSVAYQEKRIADLTQENLNFISKQKKKTNDLQNTIEKLQRRAKDIEHQQNIINHQAHLLQLHKNSGDKLAESLNSYYLTNEKLKDMNRTLFNKNAGICHKIDSLNAQLEVLTSELEDYRQYDRSKICRGAKRYADYRNKIIASKSDPLPKQINSQYSGELYRHDTSTDIITPNTQEVSQPTITEKEYYCPTERKDNCAPLARLFSTKELENPDLLQQSKDAQQPWEFKLDIPLPISRYLCLYLTCKVDNLTRIDLVFGTHDRINIGKIVLSVWEDCKYQKLLRRAKINAPALLNNEFASFDFLPIPHSKEKLLYITLGLEDAPNDSFPSLWYGHIGNAVERQYYLWTQKMIPWQQKDLLKMKRKLDTFSYKPLISIVMPVYKVEIKWLKSAICSIQEQAYPNWELVIVDDASNDEAINQLLTEFQKSDTRIKCSLLKENCGISNASNAALKIATGEFIGLLDHDDLLTVDALFEIAAILNQYPDIDMIYSDEDKITVDGRKVEPFFKPDWSPDLLLSCMYTCHFTVYRSSLLKKIKGFRQGFEGSQDYDLALRFTELTDRIHHIPKILYHWRKIPGSTASVYSNKDYARKAAMKSLTETLQRRKIKGSVSNGLTEYSFRVKRDIQGNPLVSIIIPFKDKVDLLRQCIESIFKKTDYENFEILCLNNNSCEDKTIQYLEKLKKNKKIRRIDYNHAFNYSAINNFAVQHACGEIVLLLNNDVEVITNDWFSSMLEHVQRPEVGAVGAQLLYPNNTIQHAGVMTGPGGIAGHAFKHINIENRTYYNGFPNMIRNVSCVTAACLMLRKEVFLTVGGFDEKNLKVAFNDVDLCLKIREKGYQIIYTPFACLYHHESASRGHVTDADEINFIKHKWSEVLGKDPFYNCNLTFDKEDFTLNTKMI